MSEPFDHLLEAYAQLVIRVGVNVQPAQRVVIQAFPEQHAVARALATGAYRVGASKVTIEYTDQHLQRAEVQYAPADQLGRVLPHMLEGVRAWREDRPAVIRLTGIPNPRLMEGTDAARLAASQPLAFAQAMMSFTQANAVAWTVVAAPTAGWAESVLGTADVARLWEAVSTAMRLDEDDPVRSWQEHLDALKLRRDMLNARKFDQVRYRGPGTDLTVGLSSRSLWQSAAMTNSQGTEFVANMPTEEVFVSPDWRRADGFARTTAPFFLPGMNVLVESLELEFADGTVRAAVAQRGEDAVRHQLEGTPGARHLGEVAIVDRDSRVRRTGLVFNDILFDENVGSHVAWGSGLAMAFQGGADMSREERVKAGLNQSPVHVDVVLGSPEVEIDGVARDGTVVPITRGDEFVLADA